jgi:hypothetical protein
MYIRGLVLPLSCLSFLSSSRNVLYSFLHYKPLRYTSISNRLSCAVFDYVACQALCLNARSRTSASAQSPWARHLPPPDPRQSLRAPRHPPSALRILPTYPLVLRHRWVPRRANVPPPLQPITPHKTPTLASPLRSQTAKLYYNFRYSSSAWSKLCSPPKLPTPTRSASSKNT